MTDFKSLIKSVLSKGNLKPKYVDMLLDDYAMSLYKQAFTSETIDSVHNYENYEQLGDAVLGQFIIWYAYRRFPELKTPEGVKVIARLKINLVKKDVLYRIGEKLGFWPFIIASEEERNSNMKSLIEDVFEAFIGVIVWILDERITQGVGYAIVYDLLKNLYDDVDISLDRNELLDAKTRLKEIFDTNKITLGPKVLYDNIRIKDGKISQSTVYYINKNGEKVVLGIGTSAKKSDAEQKASEIAIDMLTNEMTIRTSDWNSNTTKQEPVISPIRKELSVIKEIELDNVFFHDINEPNGILSNFYKSKIIIDGDEWPTVQHYFEAQKFSNRPDIVSEFRNLNTALAAKKLGKRRDIPMRRDWERVKDQVMYKAIKEKFTQNNTLKQFLINTGDKNIVNRNLYDHYWGDGGDGTGKNKLGIILMQIRDEIIEAEISSDI